NIGAGGKNHKNESNGWLRRSPKEEQKEQPHRSAQDDQAKQSQNEPEKDIGASKLADRFLLHLLML
ncbi:MAG: hypothetical protein NTW74_10780, partial [Acidobacteria bacterium]|nr:hypothetical protein [Acidobacteriota bacterium]